MLSTISLHLLSTCIVSRYVASLQDGSLACDVEEEEEEELPPQQPMEGPPPPIPQVKSQASHAAPLHPLHSVLSN